MEMNIRKGTPNDAILASKLLNPLLSERYVQIPTHRELTTGITGVHRNLDPFIAGNETSESSGPRANNATTVIARNRVNLKIEENLAYSRIRHEYAFSSFILEVISGLMI